MDTGKSIIKFVYCIWLIGGVLTSLLWARQNEIQYDLDLEFNARKSTLSGREIITFTNHTSTYLDTIYLYLQANAFRNYESRSYQKYENQFEAPAYINIDSVTIDGLPVNILNPKAINPAVILTTPLLPGNSVTLAIRFITKIPAGKSYLCSTHSEKLYRLIYFFPRVTEYRQNRWLLNVSENFERPPSEFATYSLKFSLPHPFQLAGSLQPDSVQIGDNRNIYYFRPEYLQGIGFILNDKLRFSTVHREARGELKLVNRISANDHKKDKIVTEIIRDIVDYYLKYFIGSYHHLTIYPTIVRGGFATSNFILLDKEIFSGVTRLDYLSINVLAQEIARQYLGSDLTTVENQAVSISYGLAGLMAQDYLNNRYQFLRNKYQVPENRLITYTNKFMNIFTTALEKENILQQTGASNDRANSVYLNNQIRFLKSQKLVEMTRYTLGDSLFFSVLAQYRECLQSNYIAPLEFFRLAEQNSGYRLTTFIQYCLDSEQPVDLKIQDVKRTRPSRTEYRTDVVIKQTPPVNLPLEIDATDRSGQVYSRKELLRAVKYDTLTFVTMHPLRKISLDPRCQIWDVNRYNNQYPRSIVFKFLIGFPSIDSYQVFYYPTFDFNQEDLTRVGIKLRGRYWINMRPLFPAQSLDEWSLGLNYGYKSKTLGYDLSYSTSLLEFLFKPRLNLRFRDYFDLLENQVSTEIYLGDIKYWGLNRVQGYQKLNFGVDYQNVRSLDFLNSSNWETGQSLKPYLDYVNFHNWGNARHILQIKFTYGWPVDANHFNFDKLTIDGQVKLRLNRRFWLYQRLFIGNAHGHVPKQEYFYFFGKNVLENQTFESYRMAKGEGDMRGYGEQSLKGLKILTSNTELRRNLAGVDAAMFDVLLFIDSGILPESFEDIDWEKTCFDAGLGTELDILEAVRLGVHFPVWISHPQSSEKPLAFRWVLAVDLTL